MTRIGLEPLAKAIITVRALDLKGKERWCDEIFAEQPCLLASCLALPRMGVSMPKLECLLHILLVCFQAMKETGLEWPSISEDDQERQLARWGGAVRFSESLEPALGDLARSDYFTHHSEQPLLAFVIHELTGWLAELTEQGVAEESDKFVIMAAVNLVQCIASVPMIPG